MLNKLLLLMALLGLFSVASAETIELFANGDLGSWRVQTFDDLPRHTKYAIIEESTGPKPGRILEGIANDSVSGYIYEHQVPFTREAVFKVTYQVIDGRNPADEKTKAGDDFPLRIYLTAKNFLTYKTLVLVHSLQYPAGETWDSPYSGAFSKFQIHVIASKQVGTNDWFELEIPVGELWVNSFGENPDMLEGFAFMMDSDNAHGTMHTKLAHIEYKY